MRIWYRGYGDGMTLDVNEEGYGSFCYTICTIYAPYPEKTISRYHIPKSPYPDTISPGYGKKRPDMVAIGYQCGSADHFLHIPCTHSSCVILVCVVGLIIVDRIHKSNSCLSGVGII